MPYDLIQTGSHDQQIQFSVLALKFTSCLFDGYARFHNFSADVQKSERVHCERGFQIKGEVEAFENGFSDGVNLRNLLEEEHQIVDKEIARCKKIVKSECGTIGQKEKECKNSFFSSLKNLRFLQETPEELIEKYNEIIRQLNSHQGEIRKYLSKLESGFCPYKPVRSQDLYYNYSNFFNNCKNQKIPKEKNKNASSSLTEFVEKINISSCEEFQRTAKDLQNQLNNLTDEFKALKTSKDQADIEIARLNRWKNRGEDAQGSIFSDFLRENKIIILSIFIFLGIIGILKKYFSAQQDQALSQRMRDEKIGGGISSMSNPHRNYVNEQDRGVKQRSSAVDDKDSDTKTITPRR